MANTVNFSLRIDSEVKRECDELFNQLGLNLTTAINIFLRKCLSRGGLPFEVCGERPNKETIEAMLEAERIAHDPNVKHYTDLDELFEDLRK